MIEEEIDKSIEDYKVLFLKELDKLKLKVNEDNLMPSLYDLLQMGYALGFLKDLKRITNERRDS